MKAPKDVAIKARGLRIGNGVEVPAIAFMCRSCGRRLRPGEGSRTCPDCGSHDIATVADPARTVVVRRAC